jgi:glycine cleavage system aminomethyltransferase T
MGQRTPLYDLHLALGAKMVDRRSRNTIRCVAIAVSSMYPT